jgi:spermidine/putrescine transport system ATP-binding protein
VNRFVADFIGETNFLTGEAAGGRVRLPAGATIDAEGAEGRSGTVTVAVRPEQVRLVEPDMQGAIHARIADWVYFGTDTHCHLHLKDGTEVVARLQSPPSGDPGLRKGATVGLRFTPGAARVLAD